MPDLSNTPGIYYAVAYWLAGMFYTGMNQKKLRGIRLCLVQAGFLLVITTFMVLTDGIQAAFFIPCIVLDILLIFLFMKLCCKVTWYKAAYYGVRAFLLGEFAASLEWQFVYFGLTALKLPLKLGWNIILLVLVHGIVFGVMYLLERRHRTEGLQMHIGGKEFCSALLLGVFAFAVSNLSYVVANTPFSSRFTFEIYIIRTLVDFSGVAVLFAYHLQLLESHVNMEMNFLQNLQHLQYENYKISKESIALVNQKYHDLKHQIQLLRSEIDSEEKLKYLDQMEQEIKAYETQNKTGNTVLDTILSAKSIQCQSKGITLTCVADGKEIEFMHPMDISALFGNALDNAIESVKKIDNPEKRLIHVSVAKQKNFVRIRFENCYEGEILFENGVPATTKNNKKYHGFGIKSIQKIVEKYSGSMTISTKNGWFELRILLPV